MADPNNGTVHVMEEAMRAAEQGVFEAKSMAAPTNKARKAAPENKELPAATMAQTKDELLAIANTEGVKVESDDNKADLVAKIEKARK